MKHGSDDHRRLVAELSVAVSTIRSGIELNSHCQVLREQSLDEFLWQLDDLRRFRHLFRHMYDRPLDSERVRKMQQLWVAVLPGFLAAHERFVEKVQFIAAKVTDE